MNTLNNNDNEPLLFPELEEFFRPQTKTTSEEENMSEENYKTISEVAKELDIAASVIRYWETKFETLSPVKRNGRRYFSIDQQKVIAKIKDLLYVQGYTIRAAQDLILKGGSASSEDEKSEEQIQPKVDKEFIGSVIIKLNQIKETLR